MELKVAVIFVGIDGVPVWSWITEEKIVAGETKGATADRVLSRVEERLDEAKAEVNRQAAEDADFLVSDREEGDDGDGDGTA